MPRKSKTKHHTKVAHVPKSVKHISETLAHVPIPETKQAEKAPTSFFGRVHAWVKKTRAISKVLNLVKHVDPKLALAHAVATKHGYGRYRRRKIMGGSQRRGTNTLTQVERRVALTTQPFEIPKLSFQLRRYNNSLGL